ncbi:MAG: hypothetical protein LAO21_18805 [Acidobacteriia bacterium]|nr:hypothetical protein [Terriglobia bacterium]
MKIALFIKATMVEHDDHSRGEGLRNKGVKTLAGAAGLHRIRLGGQRAHVGATRPQFAGIAKNAMPAAPGLRHLSQNKKAQLRMGELSFEIGCGSQI